VGNEYRATPTESRKQNVVRQQDNMENSIRCQQGKSFPGCHSRAKDLLRRAAGIRSSDLRGTRVMTSEKNWERLRKDYLKKGIALALGAGVSMDCKLPNWYQLLERISEKCFTQNPKQILDELTRTRHHKRDSSSFEPAGDIAEYIKFGFHHLNDVRGGWGGRGFCRRT
jgi:hypothetical protein